MKIALVCDWYLPRTGGIERHLGQLAAHLATAGHDVTVITPTRGSAESADGVRVERVPAWLLPKIGLAWTPTSFRRLGAILRAGNFDVVHAHSSLISPTAYAAIYHAQRAGLPTVLTVHSIWGGFARTFGALDAAFRWTRWPVAFSAVSERVARDLRPLLGSTPVEVLPNALVPAEWQLALRPPKDVIALACVTRLAPRKRGAALLRAFRTVRDQLPAGTRVRLQIAGDGPERVRLERLARRLDLSDCVRFRGSLPTADVKVLLAESHLFVLPTILESFGIAALEARAAGLPVVAMRAGGVSQFIVHEQEGLLAADDTEFARHLLRLCNDAPLRAAITAHNQRMPVAFTWDRTLAAHAATYARARQLRPAAH
jgi:glycosyltransferase involved in cell wall biosynthesis